MFINILSIYAGSSCTEYGPDLRTVTAMSVSFSELGADEVKIIVNDVNRCSPGKLSISTTRFKDDGIKMLLEFLKDYPTQLSLNLSGGQIGDESVNAFTKLLEENFNLTIQGIDDRRVQSLSERNAYVFQTHFLQIMSADRSTVKNVFYPIWWNVARFLGCPEDFIRRGELQGIMDIASDRTKSIEKMRAYNIARVMERDFKVSIRSSKMGIGNTEADFNSISNEDSPQMARLRTIYYQQPENVRKEFSFHRWLKIQNSFYDRAMRNVVKSKPSFEAWLNNKMFYEKVYNMSYATLSFVHNIIICFCYALKYCFDKVGHGFYVAITYIRDPGAKY